MALVDEIRLAFPWLFELGFGPVVEQGIRDDQTWDQIIANVRQSAEYDRQFPGMQADDGSRRFATEAEYMRAVEDYRNVLKEFGMYDPSVDGPQNYTSFFDSQIDPNELRDRLNVYRAIERGSQELKDAFYVYAGLEVTDEQLYEAVVSPGESGLIAEYSARTAGTTLDYETFINRTAEVSMARLGRTVAELRQAGVIGEVEAQQLLGADPQQARNLLGAIYAGNSGARPLALEELTTAFQYALLGSAASEQGLVMPDRDRLEQFRQAGVTRAQATQAYGTYSAQQSFLQGASQRAGGRVVSQDLYEEAVLLGRGDALSELRRAVEGENALGRATGGFNVQVENERVTQFGRR